MQTMHSGGQCILSLTSAQPRFFGENSINNNNNTAGDAPYVNENILSNMKKLNRRRDCTVGGILR